MQSKTQRKRTPKAPVTPEQAMIDKAVEVLVSEGVYTGEEGFRSLIHRISKSYIQAALRGELTAHLNGEKEVADAEDSKTKPIYQAELLGRSSSRSLALDAPTQSHYVKTRGRDFSLPFRT